MTTLPLTWVCHVCGDERPDALIAVDKTDWQHRGTRVRMTTNVRYCRDRPACLAGAPLIASGWVSGGDYEIVPD